MPHNSCGPVDTLEVPKKFSNFIQSSMVLDVVISGLNTAVTFRRYNHEPQSKIAPGIIVMSDDDACHTNGSVTC